MNPEQIQRLNCDLDFGLSGLQNTCLLDNFYPPDLPSDWRLDFYANEFNLLLISLSDVDIKLPLSSDSISRLIDYFSAMADDACDAACVLFFDLSGLNGTELPADSAEIILNSKLMDNSCFKLVDLQTSFLGKESEAQLPFTLCQPIDFSRASAAGDWFCVVHDEDKIKPPALKTLLENIHNSVMQQDPESNFNSEKNVIPADTISIVVIFTSGQYALENCRNAMLLKSMM